LATLATFRTEVTAILGLDNTVAGDQTLVDSWLNEGVESVVLRTRCKVLPATITLTAGTSNYTLPTAILAILDIYVTSGSSDYGLERASPSEILLRRRNSTNDSPPRLYAIDGANMLMVYPTPSAADTLHVTYTPRPATLASGSDTPSEIPSEWHKLVTFYALSRAADFDDDASSQMGERYRGLFEQGLAEMRRTLTVKGGRRLAPARVNPRKSRYPAHPSTSPAFR